MKKRLMDALVYYYKFVTSNSNLHVHVVMFTETTLALLSALQYNIQYTLQ